MSFTIYGLRLKGDGEVRYIGQTMRTPEVRLEDHLSAADHAPVPQGLSLWLLDNRESVEVFRIDELPAVQEAKMVERALIKAFARLGHRLFNCHHLPKSARIPRHHHRATPPARAASLSPDGAAEISAEAA